MESRSRIFISHAYGTRTDEVRAVLREADLEGYDWKSVPSGASWAHALEQALENCHALLAVANDANTTAAVQLEIGMALGKRLPVVLILESAGDIAKVPAPLRELPYLIVGGDVRAAADRLRIALENAGSAQAQGPGTSRSHRDSYREIDSALEGAVARVFEQAGARIVTQPVVSEVARADLAVYFYDLIAPGLSPIIVEVAGYPHDLNASAEQIRHWLQELNLFFGVVVSAGSVAPAWTLAHGKAVLTVGFEALVRLSPEQLRAVLTDGRNKLMHGIR